MTHKATTTIARNIDTFYTKTHVRTHLNRKYERRLSQCEWFLDNRTQIVYDAYTNQYNPSCVCGWDRKIRPEDHRLALRGLPSDDKL